MPIHDWTRVPAGLFHDFHQSWTVRLTEALNAGRLPRGLAALVEQRVGGTKESYRANRIVIRRHLVKNIAVIEVVSPGNKGSRSALLDFVEETIDFLRYGIHVLIVDLFPPTSRDPCDMHKAIWDAFVEQEFTFPEGKDRTIVSYATGNETTTYLELLAVGDKLPEMPLFLTNDSYVMVPLERTYGETWAASAEALRIAVETGVLPGDSDE